MRCAFGAVRVGALLGRVRLHLQTDRFLAVHRGDALWEESCRQAALALAEIVSRMPEGEMDSPLASPHGRSHPSEDEGWGTRKTSFEDEKRPPEAGLFAPDNTKIAGQRSEP
jgi:hypothetical protein